MCHSQVAVILRVQQAIQACAEVLFEIFLFYRLFVFVVLNVMDFLTFVLSDFFSSVVHLIKFYLYLFKRVE
jgi:hypothetical protein